MERARVGKKGNGAPGGAHTAASPTKAPSSHNVARPQAGPRPVGVRGREQLRDRLLGERAASAPRPAEAVAAAAPSRSPPSAAPAPRPPSTRERLKKELQARHGGGEPRADLEPMKDGAAPEPMRAPSVHEIARRGVEGAGARLPFLDQIQRSFGPEHDLSGVRVGIGGEAARTNRALDAGAYATGERIAFSEAPTLCQAAHEATHVLQQSGASRLGRPPAVGAPGDAWEREADAAAELVVQGRSAGHLFSGAPMAPSPRPGDAVQFDDHKSGGKSFPRTRSRGPTSPRRDAPAVRAPATMAATRRRPRPETRRSSSTSTRR